MRDQGPVVYFRPQDLDAALCELLRKRQIQHTRVNVRVYYRTNGRDRWTREVRFLEEDGAGQGDR